MKKFIQHAAVVLVALAGIAQGVSAQFPEREIQFLAHRGSAHEQDENTIAAFKACLDAGIRGFETDVHLNKDQELVISHDESLKRCCGVDKVIEEMTTAELKQVRTLKGNPIPLCQELVDLLAQYDNIYIEYEIKTGENNYTEAQLEILCDKLYKMAMAKKQPHSLYIFSSFDIRALKIMRRLHPEAELMLIDGNPCTRELVDKAYHLDFKRLACRTNGSRQEAVRYAHERGMIVSLWSNTNEEDYLLSVAYGTDCLCCDKAVRVSEWAKKNTPYIKLKGVGAGR